ncbi:transcription factor CP2-like protein 1 isoform X3 [Ursus americanus]|uniref:transcription factor CP2-like protein 1 isoform X3 n=1 Tax=Ursus americanus TaxID=9643 RepID=UPI001E679DBF|nr:transcription factor CP2-like protein 1 isoform X3 [Ursus americanus]
MLFWHNQPEHLWPSPGELYPGPPSGLLRESLPLSHLKQEELPNIPSSEPPCPAFQYVLCAATSPAVKQQEETLTYLNQGQSYEVRMLCDPKLSDATQWARLVKAERGACGFPRPAPAVHGAAAAGRVEVEPTRGPHPGHRCATVRGGDRTPSAALTTQHSGVPLGPNQEDLPLPAGEPEAGTGARLEVRREWQQPRWERKVHCISTEFTPRKKGGEKGVPFRLQIDTFKPGDKDLPPEHLHSAGCLIKVFKPKGADRKLKTDREKLEKQPLPERDKYQSACESTVLVECSPWPDASAGPSSPLSPLARTSPHSCKLLSPDRLCFSPPLALDTLGGSPAEDLNPGASILETQQWLHQHRFSSYCRLLANFTGTDLLKLTRQDLIQICGAADGIRLCNALRARPIRHRLTLYVAPEASRHENDGPKNPDSGEVLAALSRRDSAPGFYQEISLDELSAVELMGKLAELLALPANQIRRLFHQGPGGILILLSDQVVQNLKDESYFVAVVKKVQDPDGYYLVLT